MLNRQVQEDLQKRKLERTRRRRYYLRTGYAKCDACGWKGRRPTDVPESEWSPCPPCGGVLRGARRDVVLDKGVVMVRVRSLLSAASNDLGIARGIAPSQAAYDGWSKKNRRPTSYQLRRMVGRAFKIRGALGRGWRAEWSEVAEKAGLEPWGKRKVVESEVVADVARVAELLGHPGRMPRHSEYVRLGRYTRQTVVATVLQNDGSGSWHDVATVLGLKDPDVYRYGLRPRETVVRDYRQLSVEAGHKPGGVGLGQKKFARMAGYSYNPRYGPWQEIVEDAGFIMRDQPKQFADAQAGT